VTLFAKPRIDDPDELIGVECISNRELHALVDNTHLFFVMSQEIHEKYGINSDLGEMLIYSPHFEPELSCMWVAQTIDFDFVEAP